jgi:hypothetical protein
MGSVPRINRPLAIVSWEICISYITYILSKKYEYKSPYMDNQ